MQDGRLKAKTMSAGNVINYKQFQQQQMVPCSFRLPKETHSCLGCLIWYHIRKAGVFIQRLCQLGS